jgi:hypothetical protein
MLVALGSDRGGYVLEGAVAHHPVDGGRITLIEAEESGNPGPMTT